MCMILNDYRSRKPYQCPIAVIDLTNDSDTEEDELASTEPQSTIPIAGNEPVVGVIGPTVPFNEGPQSSLNVMNQGVISNAPNNEEINNIDAQSDGKLGGDGTKDMKDNQSDELKDKEDINLSK